MEEKIKIESIVLNDKRKKIMKELEEKRKTQEEVINMLKILTKESKGGYNQEKENVEKIYQILNKEIESYEEALKNPYFGRVDFTERLGDHEEIYIGKKGISSTSDGDEIVVDWRAPVADLYYSGTGGNAYYRAPMGVIEGELELKRKFLFEDKNIKQIFDEEINKILINGLEGEELVDEFLKINLEESRGKKLKEVVATIQKEQNDIIRWPKNLPLIVQGAAGSGKTTIALHRLAYLLYRYRESMEGKDILVLAPNKLFLDYISDILPNLGSTDVNETTFQELVVSKLKLKGKIRTKDDKLKEIIETADIRERKCISNASKIKGNLIFKVIIDRYIALLESSSLEINDIEIKGYVLFSKREITRLYLKDLKAYPLNKRKDEIKRYLSLKLKEKITSLVAMVDRDWQSKINTIKNTYEDGEERRRKLIEIYNERDSIKEYIKKESKKVMNDYFKNWRGITSNDIYINLFKDDELFEIADVISVLRDGQMISTHPIELVDRDVMISEMVGRKIDNIYPTVEKKIGEPVLEVRNLKRQGIFHNISFHLKKGEILGIAGMVGAGRTEVVTSIFGIDKYQSGEIFLNGKKVDIYSPKSAIQNHIALVPEDRARCGLNLGATIRSNMCTTILNKTSKFHGALSDSKAEYNYTRLMMDKMHIKATGSEQEAGSLSGGNQQKIVVGKWLLTEPEIVFLDEPTRGIDVGAKYEIYQLIQKLAKEGKAIIMISSEMPELLGICDRVLVMRNGEIAGEMDVAEATQEKIMSVIVGEQ